MMLVSSLRSEPSASALPRHALILLLSTSLAAACTQEGGVEEGVPEGAEPPAVSPTLPPGAEAISLLGETLQRPEQPDEVRAVYEERFAEAERALARAPEDADSLIWMGRRTAYLGRYREAIDVYTRALAIHPDDARIYRHRGHRYLTVRELDRAIADFERAADLVEGIPDEIEPDGLPNAINQPLSTLQFNIWYHLALAHYVRGDLEQALEAQRRCLEVSGNPDLLVATSYWLYMTLVRTGRESEAAELLEGIAADMEIIENDAYHQLLLLFKGERTVEDLAGPSGDAATLQSTTTAYGVGAWHLLEGRTAEAHATWERIIEGRNQWPAFGYLAAEGELARAAAR
jgi:tetratricopeptide (TPR) repeat protein